MCNLPTATRREKVDPACIPIGDAYDHRMESLQRLRIFTAVHEAGSFSRAAVALHMSQPAVSQQIAALEREMGTTLVARSTRGVQLTDAGHVVHRHALAILRSARDARRELAALEGSTQRLRVAAFPSACATLLPEATRMFRGQSPGVDVQFDELDAEPTIELVKKGSIDVGIVFDYAARPLADRALRFRHLLDDPLFIGLPADHPKGVAPIVDLVDLAEDDWISGTAFSCGEVLQAMCGSAGFTPRVAMESNRYPTTVAMIAAGHGVALIPSLATITAHTNINVRLLRPDPPCRRVWAITGKGDDESPATRSMLDCLSSAASARLPRTASRRGRRLLFANA